LQKEEEGRRRRHSVVNLNLPSCKAKGNEKKKKEEVVMASE